VSGKLTVWCDACNQDTIAHDDGRCVWCDGPTRVKQRRGGGKPKGKYRKITDDQVRALHKLYVGRGLSCRQLGGLVWEKFGYASELAAGEGIYRAFKELDLPRRSQREVTVARNLKHGRKTRAQTNEEQNAYRRWLAEQRGWNRIQGPGQPRCEGIKRQSPRKGERCKRPALEGSRFCQSHEPSRELQRQATTARMRRQIPARELVEFEPFARWVEGTYRELGTLKAVADVLGCSPTTVMQFIHREQTSNGGPRQPRTHISRAALDRYLARPEVPVFEQIYEAERAAA
jgi:hypothetical protein